MLKISMDDNITPLTKYWLADHPQFVQSLSKSLAWFVSKNIKQLTRDSKLTGRWPKRTPAKFRKAIDKHGRAPNQWLGRMRNAIVYQYLGNNKAVVGWATRGSAWYGKVFEEGIDSKITQKARRYYAAKGQKIPANGQTDVPERPIYQPAMGIINPQIPAFVESRVQRYMEKGRGGFTAPKRLYEVFR